MPTSQKQKAAKGRNAHKHSSTLTNSSWKGPTGVYRKNKNTENRPILNTKPDQLKRCLIWATREAPECDLSPCHPKQTHFPTLASASPIMPVTPDVRAFED